MCFFGGGIPQDNSAAIARAEEAARQNRIREGEARIANAFGQFNDPYFAKVSSDYLDYYQPQLRDQYVDARKGLTYTLGRSGGLNTSAGAARLGKLFEEYNKQRTALADRATSAGTEARSRVESARADLLAQNRAMANPSQIASLAASQAGILSAPQSYNPLGDVFAAFLNQGANALALQAVGFPGWGLPLVRHGPASWPISATGSSSMVP